MAVNDKKDDAGVNAISLQILNDTQPPEYSAEEAQSSQLRQAPTPVEKQEPNGLDAECAMRKHKPETKYGILGIIVAVLFIPLGLICLFLDTQEVCARCGQKLE
ncbi:hypothetical protein Hypma_005984 [Hypsizygus marmoreus]|uniref:Brain protein I3 n=1 Tax=Hypsizygus marmoreus TaxID=39966 RepID=A0A369KDC8_HYPMA|nr:hypothetical protein Hypma_005984 [Hypsizygus marmoreus]